MNYFDYSFTTKIVLQVVHEKVHENEQRQKEKDHKSNIFYKSMFLELALLDIPIVCDFIYVYGVGLG